MKITNIEIKNFRLLKSVSLSIESDSTVIVGRNNSGKTSLTEVFRRILSDKTPSFSVFDFSSSAIESFSKAFELFVIGSEESTIRKAIPYIEIKITVNYDKNISDLGTLSDFVIDLNEANTSTIVCLRYQLNDGKIKDLFEGFSEVNPDTISSLNKSLKERIPKLFSSVVLAIDPTDNSNTAKVEFTKFKNLFEAGFINAQRGLDDITSSEKDVLGKVLNKLFKTANIESAPADLRDKSIALEKVVSEIQTKIDTDFNEKLDALLPALQIFGYPGLADPNFSTETILDIGNILESNTKIRYGHSNGLFLPETYNGLGSRNLIYILFQLFEFFRDFQSRLTTPGMCLVFIEEPEAHLHPQMQQVFINQLSDVAKQFSKIMNGGIEWPVQFIVTTHSTHIANEAQFEAIRYFLADKDKAIGTRVKDLREEFRSEEVKEDKEFLHKYLTLTRCDLYFADKVILIEGPTERILMPKIIEKMDEGKPYDKKLSSQYVSLIEIGGAYAHHFYKFLDFLEIKSLVITDLDSVVKTVATKTTYPACEVAKGTHSSNAGIKNWFDKTGTGFMSLKTLTGKSSSDKITGIRRISYQIPDEGKTACGRSFEDAFMLTNPTLFGLIATTQDALATESYEKTDGIEKTNFALKYALEQTKWTSPLYISEGLEWLSDNIALGTGAKVVTIENKNNPL